MKPGCRSIQLYRIATSLHAIGNTSKDCARFSHIEANRVWYRRIPNFAEILEKRD